MSKGASGGMDDANPIKSDAELQMLVKKLDRIKKYKTFQRWRDGFLSRFQDFLYESGMAPAETACNDLEVKLKTLVTKTTKVLDFIHTGDLGEDKKTVKASLALNEMCNSLEQVRSEIETLVPALKSDEKKKGFSKFHLGAALIRQGFHQYISMKAVEDAITEIGEKLEYVADRQQHELFDYYHTQVQRFCDVMADLNLYAIMLKCVEFSIPPDEDESEEAEYYQIIVQHVDGRKLRMEVDAKDSIDNVKNAIQTGLDIPAPKQVLQFNGVLMEDGGKLMEDLGVRDGDVFFVEPSQIAITIQTPVGLVELMVDPSIFVPDLKRMLESASGIPGKNQNLTKDGEELDDAAKKLEDYGIETNTVLNLEPKVIKVNIEMPAGEGKSFQLMLSPKDETPAIKEKIAAQTGMPETRQVLKYNDEELPSEGVTSKDMGITDGSTIVVTIFKIPVTVNTSAGQIKLMVEPSNRLSSLKRLLEPESGITEKNQLLTMVGKELADPNWKLVDYGIEAGAVLDLEPKTIRVHVRMPDGKPLQIEVSPEGDSRAIKDKISEQTGMPAARQVLMQNGDKFPEAAVTCKAMGLNDGSTIDVEIFKVPVTVNNWDGKTIAINVEPSDSLATIKKMLEPESGIPYKNQVLSRNGSELTGDGESADTLGIVAGSVLDLEPRIITIKVHTPDGQSHNVDVALTNTEDEIKKRIEEKTGIAVPRQVVKHDSEELPAGATAKDMGLRDGSEVTVDIFKIPVTVNNWDGKTIAINVEPSDSLATIKKMLEPESGIPYKNQVLSRNGSELTGDGESADALGIVAGSVLDLEPRIITIKVHTPDGQSHNVDVALTNTEDEIKKRIEEKTGIAVPRQVVKHDSEELPAGATAKDMGLRDGSEVTVDIFKIPVTVNNWDGKTIAINVEPSDSLATIKKMLEPESGIPYKNQVLSRNGSELTGDGESADALGIVAGSVLDLEPRIINIKVHTPDGQSHNVDVALTNTEDEIKKRIEEKTGIAVPRQVVKHDSEELPAGATAKDMGLRDGSEVTVDIFKIPVTVNNWDGKKIAINVEPSDSLATIKKMLEPESGIPYKNQVLSRNGSELTGDGESADALGIVAGSVLDLEPRIITIKVHTPDGQSHNVDVALTNTEDEIKKRIEEKTGIAVPRQVVKHDSEELPAGATAKDMGLRDGSEVTVDIFKIPVTVNNWDGKTIAINVEPSDSLATIKKMLEPESGIAYKNQFLAKEGNEIIGDSKSLEALRIQAGSVLELEPKLIKISVSMPDGVTKQVEISPSDDGKAMKHKIETQTGLLAPRQDLTFEGKEIPKNGFTAKALGIGDGSSLKAEILRIPVSVNCWDAKKINIMVEPTEKLSCIKSRLEPDAGIIVSNQAISMVGKELVDDTKTAYAHGIVAGSTLDLEPKSIDITVTMPDGKKHQIQIAPSDDSHAIKMIIEKETGMEAPRQSLEFNKTEIPQKTRAKDVGLRAGSNIDVGIFKVPIVVNMWDGNVIKIMVDPTDKLIEIKKLLEPESSIPAKNQILSMFDTELSDDNKIAKAYGIQKGSVMYLEPRYMEVSVVMPDETTCTFDVTANATGDDLKGFVAGLTGISPPRQVLKFNNKEIIADFTVRGMGIKHKATIQCTLYKIPITVETHIGKKISLLIEPIETINGIKALLVEDSGLVPHKQVLKFNEQEMDIGTRTATDYGIRKGSALYMEPKDDPIVFVDVKFGTLFGVDRDEVIEVGILTTNQGNKLEFNEAISGASRKAMMLKSMLDSPNLGVKPRIVVEKLEVEDYDLEEAEQVKSKWGVQLKKTQKNKRGEELIFVDIKTGAVGLVDRGTAMDKKFITPVGQGKNETLKEAEQNTRLYDKYVTEIRAIFGIKATV